MLAIAAKLKAWILESPAAGMSDGRRGVGAAVRAHRNEGQYSSGRGRGDRDNARKWLKPRANGGGCPPAEAAAESRCRREPRLQPAPPAPRQRPSRHGL